MLSLKVKIIIMMLKYHSMLQKRYYSFLLFTLNEQAPLQENKLKQKGSFSSRGTLTYPCPERTLCTCPNDQDLLQMLCPVKTSSD